MKATHIAKSIAVTTALGVFLTGCGGGPDTNTNNRTATPTTSNTGSNTPYVAPVTSGGSGTIGFAANDAIDATATNAIMTKLDKIGKDSKKAKKSSNSAANSSLMAAIFGGLAASLLVASAVNTGIKTAKAPGGSAGKGALAGATLDQSLITAAAAKKGATEAATETINPHTSSVGDHLEKVEVANGVATAAYGTANLKVGAASLGKIDDLDKKRASDAAQSRERQMKAQSSLDTANQNLVEMNANFKKFAEEQLKIVSDNVIALQKNQLKTADDVEKMKLSLGESNTALAKAQASLSILEKNAAAKDEVEKLKTSYGKMETDVKVLDAKLTTYMAAQQALKLPATAQANTGNENMAAPVSTQVKTEQPAKVVLPPEAK